MVGSRSLWPSPSRFNKASQLDPVLPSLTASLPIPEASSQAMRNSIRRYYGIINSEHIRLPRRSLDRSLSTDQILYLLKGLRCTALYFSCTDGGVGQINDQQRWDLGLHENWYTSYGVTVPRHRIAAHKGVRKSVTPFSPARPCRASLEARSNCAGSSERVTTRTSG
ncbi:uncharacterized protein LAESUDRAFT_491595 [Laetiporus sulphureus 93-53]|uniref:Uncharacterized protein n=1 Tax=Laetiporus sulphureus 93-53 TaxID=1314785 RepID=A0A165BL21_9APHY|nr:uncharacterized protein LAESUDRAFT_491595 [Laetiporus sulphureus 93-53]KZT01250.1 hypothetical protein LAESUDRAFT_491595 [Laetiporus sulphureus 93-53]